MLGLGRGGPVIEADAINDGSPLRILAEDEDGGVAMTAALLGTAEGEPWSRVCADQTRLGQHTSSSSSPRFAIRRHTSNV